MASENRPVVNPKCNPGLHFSVFLLIMSLDINLIFWMAWKRMLLDGEQTAIHAGHSIPHRSRALDLEAKLVNLATKAWPVKFTEPLTAHEEVQSHSELLQSQISLSSCHVALGAIAAHYTYSSYSVKFQKKSMLSSSPAANVLPGWALVVSGWVLGESWSKQCPFWVFQKGRGVRNLG